MQKLFCHTLLSCHAFENIIPTIYNWWFYVEIFVYFKKICLAIPNWLANKSKYIKNASYIFYLYKYYNNLKNEIFPITCDLNFQRF
jgi:hypothetical protein